MSWRARQRRNTSARSSAGRVNKRWTTAELEAVKQWRGGERQLLEIAKEIGRTPESCRQAFYRARIRELGGAPASEPTYAGAAEREPCPVCRLTVCYCAWGG